MWFFLLPLIEYDKPVEIIIYVNENPQIQDHNSNLVKRCLRDDFQFYLDQVLSQSNLKNEQSIRDEFKYCRSYRRSIEEIGNIIWKSEADLPSDYKLPCYSFNPRKDPIPFGNFEGGNLIWMRPYFFLRHFKYLVQLRELSLKHLRAGSAYKSDEGLPFLEWNRVYTNGGQQPGGFQRDIYHTTLEPILQPYPITDFEYSVKVEIEDKRIITNEFNVDETQIISREYSLKKNTIAKLIEYMDMGTGELLDYRDKTLRSIEEDNAYRDKHNFERIQPW